MWRQLLCPLAAGQEPEGGSGRCDQPLCPKRTPGHEHEPCGPDPSQPASAEDQAAVDAPEDDASKAGGASPVDDVNKGEVATPVDDGSKAGVGSPEDDASKAGVSSPAGGAASPVDDVNKGEVGTPVDDVNKGEVGTPVDDGSKAGVGSPEDDASKAGVSSPAGGAASPVDDVNKGEVGTPVDDGSKAGVASPVDDGSKAGVASPVDDVNKGEVGTPVDDVNNAGVGSPTGGTASPEDDVNKGAVGTPVDDVNKGEVETPVDDVNKAGVGSPTGGTASPEDDVNKGPSGGDAIAANVAVGSPVSDAAKPQPPEPAEQPTPPGDTKKRDEYVAKNGGDRSEGLPAEIPDEFCLEDHPVVVQFEDVTKASYFIKSGVMYTPCVPSHLPDLTGMSIFLKKDFMQYTGSFKERGARYALLMLSPEQRQRGVVSASAGNHAQALCYHGGLLGVPVTVVMPLIAPIMKVQNCRRLRANVVVKGKDMTEAKLWAMHMARERGLVYINGYDHPHVLAGQGTCGLEIVEQVPDVDAVVVPVGGGGLLAGVAVAVKNLKPAVQVIAVESEACAGWSAAVREGRPVASACGPSLADGLAVSKVGVNAFATASPLVDKVVTVPEEFIAVAILRLAELEKCVVEGAGAAGLAAVLSGRLDELKGKTVVAILSGGNIDTTVLGRVLDRGLAADGRLVKFCVPLLDRPGGLHELTSLLEAHGVSVKELAFERAWMKDDVFKLKAHVVCETRDASHAEELRAALLEQFAGQVLFGDVPLPQPQQSK